MNRLRTGYTCSKEQRKKWGYFNGDTTCECGLATENTSHMLQCTLLHLGQPSRVQRYSSSMHRAMEEDSLMIQHDDDDHIASGRHRLNTEPVPADILEKMRARDDLRSRDPTSAALQQMNDEKSPKQRINIEDKHGDAGPQVRLYQTVENYQGNRRKIIAKCCCCRPTPPACSCRGIRQPNKLR